MKLPIRHIRRPRLFSLGGLLFVTSCTVGPKYVKPAAVPPPPAYKEVGSGSMDTPGVDWSKAMPDDAAKRGAWWTLFNDTQLNDLEENATVANLSIKAADASFLQARALVRQAESGYYPTLQVEPNASVQRISQNDIKVPNFNGQTFNRFNLQRALAWEPDLWGRVRKQVESDVAAAQASAADLANVQLEIHAEIASDYFQACGLDEEVRIYQRTIANDQRTLDLTQEKLQFGTAAQGDVKQAVAQLDAVVTQAKDLAIQRSAYEDAIAALIGVPALGFTLSQCTISITLPKIPAGIPSDLLQRRPDIAAAERQVAQANAQIGLAKSAYYPSLSLNSGGGFASTHVSDWLNWPSRVWSLGASASEVVFDGGSRKAQVAQAKASYDATVANYRQSVIAAFQEVQDNLAATQVLESEVGTQGDAVAASQDALSLIVERLQQGTVSTLDVITVENTLLSNELALLSIQTRQRTSTVQLIKALGGGWQNPQLPDANNLH